MNTSVRNGIRNGLLAKRRALSAGEAQMAGQAAATSVAERIVSGTKRARGVVAGYRPLVGEIDPSPSIDLLLERGWSLVLPVCGENASMEFCPWSAGHALVSNSFGVAEPTSDPVRLETIDALIVPGVAFDKRGNRIGHGVGYYDRFFARCAQQSHDPYRLGLGYDFQIVELPDPEPWDIPMDSVVSPSKVIDTALCE